MDTEFSVHWLQDIVNEINERDEDLITLSTGKTPSGHIHLGILREIIICDSLRRILEDQGKEVRNLLFLDSLDAAKRFPGYIDVNFQKKHLGKPFSYIPCPFEECGCKSYAHHFGNELYSTFDDFGIKNQIIWTHKLYKTPEMQDKIAIALEKTDEIKEILREYILPTLDDLKKEQFLIMQESWMPVMAICEKCNKIQNVQKDGSISPNRILEYNSDKKEVSYECNACGNKSSISINSGRLKLNWRVDWPAKWAIFKTTCEPAGKDHCVKGGSYDTGLELCQHIFGYNGPIKVAYEWLRLGERDMKTSKGIVFTPKKYLEIADPEIFRYIILRTNPMKHISFRIEEIPQYFDLYERIENIFYHLEKAETEEEKQLAEFVYPLTLINEIPEEKPFNIPYKMMTFLSQIQNILSVEDLYKKAEESSMINNFKNRMNLSEFKSRLAKTENWLEEVKKIVNEIEDKKVLRTILQKITIFKIENEINQDVLNDLNPNQKQGIKMLKTFLTNKNDLDPELIQNKIFTIAKEELNIPPKQMFQAIYLVLLGKKFGPRLGSFISLLDRDWLINRLDF